MSSVLGAPCLTSGVRSPDRAWRALWECYAVSMKLADLPQVRALSAHEKLELVDELWQDLARDLDTLEVCAAEKELLDRRWAAFLRDPSSALDLKEFKERIKAQRG